MVNVVKCRGSRGGDNHSSNCLPVTLLIAGIEQEGSGCLSGIPPKVREVLLTVEAQRMTQKYQLRDIVNWGYYQEAYQLNVLKLLTGPMDISMKYNSNIRR